MEIIDIILSFFQFSTQRNPLKKIYVTADLGYWGKL